MRSPFPRLSVAVLFENTLILFELKLQACLPGPLVRRSSAELLSDPRRKALTSGASILPALLLASRCAENTQRFELIQGAQQNKQTFRPSLFRMSRVHCQLRRAGAVDLRTTRSVS